MTEEEGSKEPGDGESKDATSNGPADVPPAASTDPFNDDDKVETKGTSRDATEGLISNDDSGDSGEEHEEEDGDEDEDEDDDEEPRLKYATLTRNLNALYRNKDATSSSLVAGDKMIVGTHNGNIHVFSMPSLHSLKVYRAHSAGVSSISISPVLPSVVVAKPDATQRLAAISAEEASRSPQSSPNNKKSPRQPPVPRTPSNEIYIATSSIDGQICISSLVDPDDVQLRDFGRPIQAVALSPDYKSDKSYLSGGQAGSLILTVGGQKGKSSKATTTGAAAAASGWLGSIGLGTNTGTDRILHSGEGIISTIKWSLSGKYVLWVNEQGIKIMRSHLQLSSSESGQEWKRISHIPLPSSDDATGIWKARAAWIDKGSLDTENESTDMESNTNGAGSNPTNADLSKGVEEALVGWGHTVWFIQVIPPDEKAIKDGQVLATAAIVRMMKLDDCIISGLSLYTPNLLLILAYMEKRTSNKSKKSSDGARKGRAHRTTGLKPELRLIDIDTHEEVESDALSVDRFESLSSSDYHIAILPPIKTPTQLANRGYLGAIGSGVTAVGTGLYSGVETVGQGMWDATMYGPRKLGAGRLFSGSDSIRSGKVVPESSPSGKGNNYLTGWLPGFGTSIMGKDDEQLNSMAVSQGMKIFIFSPYDCVVAAKRNITDRLQWLIETKHYQQAWELLDEHPEAAGTAIDSSEVSSPPSPSRASSVTPSGSGRGQSPSRMVRQNTLADFFADSLSISSSQPRTKNVHSSTEKEKRRVGELWLQQLVTDKRWTEAGEVAEKVLNSSNQWYHWVYKFISSKKFDEISPHVPTFQITPPLPSQIFEIILGHYVSTNRQRFKELLDQWPSDLFEISCITTVVEEQLKSDTAPKGSSDWSILQECLAKLFLADGHYNEALKCYITLQDADTAMSLLKEHHLVEAVADDIPSLVMLRTTPAQVKSASIEELDHLSSDSIKLLVDEATHGVVEIDDVVTQLQSASLTVFLFLYLRALWRGEGSDQHKQVSSGRYRGADTSLIADEGKALVEQYADTAVELFADYDRDLLMEFLHVSTSYTYDKALKVCERHRYVEEQVYLLSKTGSMKKALFLIIDKLQDVSKAIDFAKDQDDKILWNDFLDYSMSRPKFISGLLSQVGTAINPIELVERIPSGLEIEGLREGLIKMLREYDIQDSISSGAADVLSSEVSVGMSFLREGRRRGIKFDVPKPNRRKPQEGEGMDEIDRIEAAVDHEVSPGHCAACERAFTPDETETLLGFACGHVYHISHLLHGTAEEQQHEHGVSLPRLHKDDDDEDESYTSGFTRSVGPKVINARLLKGQGGRDWRLYNLQAGQEQDGRGLASKITLRICSSVEHK